MKNEDRIIELLTEYLRKTDQTTDEIKAVNKRIETSNGLLTKSIESVEKSLESAYGILIKHAEELVALRKEALKREVQQEALLKEIFSISKRVGNLESKS